MIQHEFLDGAVLLSVQELRKFIVLEKSIKVSSRRLSFSQGIFDGCNSPQRHKFVIRMNDLKLERM